MKSVICILAVLAASPAVAQPVGDLFEAARLGAALDSSPVVRLPLPDGGALRAVITETGPTSSGYWLSGHVMDTPLSSLTVVVNGEIVVDAVWTPGARYMISTTGEGDRCPEQPHRGSRSPHD